MATRRLEVVIAGDASGARRAIGDVETHASRMGSTLGRIGHTIGLAFAGAAVGGVYALGRGLSFAVDEAREAARVNAQTDQVLQSMGAGAWTSAAGVAGLAEKLSNLSGIDDEVIQQGANLLLTFGNVKNAVGEGNDVFDRAVGLATDMSVALGQDMQSSSIQLGKALNDPIRGVTALTRVGVSFTQAQKDQIAALQESGDLLGAQRIILGEVERQFGGTAAAVATPWDRLKVTLGNLAERVGTALLPKLNEMATWLSDNLPAAIAFAEDAWNNVLKPTFEAIGRFIEDPLIPFLGELWHGFQEAWDVISTVSIAAWHVFQDVWDAIVRVAVDAWQHWIQPTWEAIVNFVYDYIRPALAYLWQAFQGAWNVIAAVANWAWRNVLQPVWNAIVWTIGNVLVPYWGFLWQAFQGAWNVIAAVANWAWRNVLQPVFNAIAWWIGNVVAPAFGWMRDVIAGVWYGISAVTSAVWNGIIGTIKWGLNTAISAINVLIRAYNRLPNWLQPGGDIGEIPHLAEGGIVTRPTLALIGEAGPEAVVPLNRAGRGGPLNQAAATGPVTVVLQVDGVTLGRVVLDSLLAHQRSNGPLPLTVR